MTSSPPGLGITGNSGLEPAAFTCPIDFTDRGRHGDDCSDWPVFVRCTEKSLAWEEDGHRAGAS